MRKTLDVGWADLLAHPAVSETTTLAGRIGLMAFHAGLEQGTGEIAASAAEAAGTSLYVVDQPADLRWHVPSRSVDPASSPALAAFVDHVEEAVGLHGYGRLGPPDPILVGGTNRALAALLAGALRHHLPGTEVVDDLGAIPVRLRGVHPANPVNLARHGGAQVELPVGVRRHHRRAVVAALTAATRSEGRYVRAATGPSGGGAERRRG